MALPVNKTLLVITAVDDGVLVLPKWSARGIKENIELIDGNDSMMACSGREIDMSHDQFNKLKVTISCTDLRAPIMPKLFKGKIVDIECTTERGYNTLLGQQDRPEVPDAYGTGISFREEGENTWYRPKLRCMIKSVTHGFDEYGASVNWSIIAVEVQVPTV